MAEEEHHQSASISDQHANICNQDKKSSNILKKNESKKENSLYCEPSPKCYIGQGNNSEL